MSETVTLNIRDDAGPDFELRPSGEPPQVQTSTHHTLWILAILLLAAVAAGGYYAYEHGLRLNQLRWWRTPATSSASAPALATAAPLAALGGTPEAIEVPPLDASDAVVRSLVHTLSSDPEIAVWLTTNGLIRNFTVVVTNIAEGHTPARHLQTLRPASAFTVVARGTRLEIDARSYDRYAAIAGAVASIDPAGAARLYATLKPRIEEAHRELGTPDPSFDVTLQKAIVTLLNTPSLDGPILVEPSVVGIGYAYHDAQLESLTSPQKQLLRMGPANVRAIQSRLREIAIALGIPATALPTH